MPTDENRFMIIGGYDHGGIVRFDQSTNVFIYKYEKYIKVE